MYVAFKIPDVGDERRCTAMLVSSRPDQAYDDGGDMSVSAQLRALLLHRPAISGAGFFLTALVLCAVPALAQIHPGDTVSVVVYNHPDLSARVTVDAAGDIALPLAGTVPARGTEPDQLAQRVRASLSRYIPKVAVAVQLVGRNQSIFVSGGPGGVLPYTPGETLSGAIAQLQSPQGVAPNTTSSTPANAATHDLLHGRVNLQQVTILRDTRVLGPYNATALHMNGGIDPSLLPGDTIQLVDKPIRVDIHGEVREPGTAYLNDGESLSEALLQVGGLTPTSATTNILLKRGQSERVVAAGGPELSTPARDGDSMTVQRAPHVGVFGAVQKPGDLVLAGDESLLSAVYNAGGPVKHANVSHVLLLRSGSYTIHDITGLTRSPEKNDNPTLRDGDAVYVPEGRNFDWNSIWAAVATAVHFIP